MAGRLVVIEGIDGAGTETQSKLLIDYLMKKSIAADGLSYPDYKHPIGKIIDEFLHRKFELRNETLVLLHLADREKDKEKIMRWLEEGKTVVLDRWITTTMAYQGLAGFPLDNLVELAKMFKIPRPDLVIYLKVSAETSKQRKLKEKAGLDRNEDNSTLMKDVGAFYEKLAEDNVFGKWVVVDGEQSKEKVFEEIKRILEF